MQKKQRITIENKKEKSKRIKVKNNTFFDQKRSHNKLKTKYEFFKHFNTISIYILFQQKIYII